MNNPVKNYQFGLKRCSELRTWEKERRIEEYNKNPRKCKLPECNNTLKYGCAGVFCSRSCSAKFNNSERYGTPKRKKKVYPKKKYPCLRCSDPSYAEFCQKCYLEIRYENFVSMWEAGNIDGLNSQGKPRSFIRRYYFEKFDGKCQKCGWGETNHHTGNIPLNLHHVDGNWRNNTKDNIELLCPNCHSLTKNYGSLNWGKGRDSRKEYRERKKLENI
jgi:hypothetical protein